MALNRMDRIQQLGYEKDFRIMFLETKGDGFQRLFEKLMAKAHPNDFMACRPRGNVGDRKNDGYLPSARTLFQSYAARVRQLAPHFAVFSAGWSI